MSKQRPDGLYVPFGALMRDNRRRIAELALKSRLPSVSVTREAVEAGGLMSYSADLADNYQRVAYYVDRILKGAKPADLPVEQPKKFEFVINFKDREADRSDDPAQCASASRSGHKIAWSKEHGAKSAMLLGGTREKEIVWYNA